MSTTKPHADQTAPERAWYAPMAIGIAGAVVIAAATVRPALREADAADARTALLNAAMERSRAAELGRADLEGLRSALLTELHDAEDAPSIEQSQRITRSGSFAELFEALLQVELESGVRACEIRRGGGELVMRIDTRAEPTAVEIER